MWMAPFVSPLPLLLSLPPFIFCLYSACYDFENVAEECISRPCSQKVEKNYCVAALFVTTLFY